MQGTVFVGFVNLALSSAALVLFVWHLAHRVSASTSRFIHRFLVWAAATLFLFLSVGSLLWMLGGLPVDIPPQQSALLVLLCDFRPSQSHTIVSALGLIVAAILNVRHNHAR